MIILVMKCEKCRMIRKLYQYQPHPQNKPMFLCIECHPNKRAIGGVYDNPDRKVSEVSTERRPDS